MPTRMLLSLALQLLARGPQRFAVSGDGGQVVDLFKETLLQAVIAQLLR
jgi:hypothetical protein